MHEAPLDGLLDHAVVARVREVLAERPDAVVTLGDPDGHLLWASAPGSLGMFGRTPSQVQGRPRWEYIHPDDLPRARRDHDRAWAGQTVQYRIRGRAADGSWVPICTVAWRVTTSWGDAILAITTADGDEDLLDWPTTLSGSRAAPSGRPPRPTSGTPARR